MNDPAPLYGEQTRLAVGNFRFGGPPMPAALLMAMARIKQSVARTAGARGWLDTSCADAIAAAAGQVADGLGGSDWDTHFPVELHQTGSGTSSNMNVNEVIATLATTAGGNEVHPNDDVNFGQSSNDVFPSAIRVAVLLAMRDRLLPALQRLADALAATGSRHNDVVKTARTHLMDAVPMTVGQEFSGFAAQVTASGVRLQEVLPRVAELPLGGTAVGTGINAPAGFAQAVCADLAELTGLPLRPAPNRFASQSSIDTFCELAAQHKVAAMAVMKIANDIRWLASGPLAGLGELQLPALQAGSSIMPGKVNPVICEAVMMIAVRVAGNDSVVTMAAQYSNHQLNTMLPLVGASLLENTALLAGAAEHLVDKVLDGLQVNRERLAQAAARNPILATALNPDIGYKRAAEIARAALERDEPILDVAREMSGLDDVRLRQLLDPKRLTGSHTGF